MDKKTRVLNCIDNKPIDKVPMVYWHHFSGENAHGKTCVAAHKKFYEETGVDFIKMMCDGFFPMDFGIPKIETPSDWAHVRPPTLKSSWVLSQADRINWMIEAIKDEACVYYVMFSSIELLGQSFGYDLCTAHLKSADSRKHMQPALDALGSFVAEAAAYLIKETGATGMLSSMSNNFRYTADEYRAYIRPQDEKIINATNAVSDYNIIHLCGYVGVKNNMEVWQDYETAVMSWDQHTDKLPISEARATFKNCRAIMGGFDNKQGTFFYTAGKDEVKAKAKEYARAGGKTGFILSADCSLTENFSYERIRWVGEALEELAIE